MQRRRPHDGPLRPDGRRVRVRPRPAAPQGRPAAAAALPPLTPVVVVAVEALSRGEGYGVLAVSLLAATLEGTDRVQFHQQGSRYL